MFKRSLMCAVAGGIMGVAASAFAATPAVPSPTTISSPAMAGNASIEQASYWWRGRSYPYRWRGNYYHHRHWYGSGWRYW